jgi:hypothetical protein
MVEFTTELANAEPIRAGSVMTPEQRASYPGEWTADRRLGHATETPVERLRVRLGMLVDKRRRIARRTDLARRIDL